VEEPSQVAIKLSAVRERIAAACRRVGRNPSEVHLVGVTKGFTAEVAAAAFVGGIRDLGENRVQEARDKIPAVESLLRRGDMHDHRSPTTDHRPVWHLVGHLQRNKAYDAVRLFQWIHSVDSLPLAREISRRAEAGGRQVNVLVQVNIAAESTKHGTSPEEAGPLAEAVTGMAGLRVRGLMTIAPLVAEPEQVRWVFRELRLLRDRIWAQRGIRLDDLSMGMTDDFVVALEEGATIVRLGRALFGER
jgi:pyridoxal phosphate enzyme (YggS family)